MQVPPSPRRSMFSHQPLMLAGTSSLIVIDSENGLPTSTSTVRANAGNSVARGQVRGIGSTGLARPLRQENLAGCAHGGCAAQQYPNQIPVGAHPFGLLRASAYLALLFHLMLRLAHSIASDWLYPTSFRAQSTQHAYIAQISAP